MLTPVSYNALQYICLNLRASDRAELFATSEHECPVRLAEEAHQAVMNLGRGAIGWVKGKPAALIALVEEWPSVWSVWMFGTNDLKKVGLPMLRWLRKELLFIVELGARRLHCDSKWDHDEAHEMILAMGGRPEAVMQRHGKGQEDFVRFVWLLGENDGVIKPGYTRADRVTSC